MEKNIYDRFLDEVNSRMEALSDRSYRLPALCAMERQWQLYLDWTRQDIAFCLRVKPETLCQPARDLLDLLWEQLEAGEAVNPHQEVYDRFLQKVEESFDEEDGQDVDFGNANLLLDALQGHGYIFFPVREEVLQRGGPLRRRAAFCATNYLCCYHGDYLTDCLPEGTPPDHWERLADEYAERDPVWLAETARVREDLEAAGQYPASREWFRQRRAVYSGLRLPPIYRARDGAGHVVTEPVYPAETAE